jgi:cyclopropane fatty-acyl-phospholipid synthase-like methyltransferase
MNQKNYLSLISYCESFLERYGDCHLGVGWTKARETADERYKLMLEVIEEGPREASLLDFGCGASHLYEYILRHQLEDIVYSGLDLSGKFIELSRAKFPLIKYYHLDILCDSDALPEFDYIVLNGVFNSKCQLSFEEMFSYFRAIVTAVFEKARIGIAFNTMSKLVEWEREDLFHLPFDLLTRFLAEHVSRNFVIRHDYGLYEYTTFVYR